MNEHREKIIINEMRRQEKNKFTRDELKQKFNLDISEIYEMEQKEILKKYDGVYYILVN